jgi:putative nucleotidyltransferase with HDIG domain
VTETVNNDSQITQRIVTKAKGVFPLPAAVVQLSQMAQNPNIDMSEMVRVISQDPALTGQILRVANSSFYGLSQMIGTVSEAVVILGLQTVRNLALGVSVFDIRNRIKKKLPLDQEDFWRHSLAVASAARLLAPRLGVRDSEEAFVAGLLHDIGKIFLMEELPELYAKVLEGVEKGTASLYALENEYFKTNHAEVGGALCREWKIPPILCAAVSHHHQPIESEAISSQEERILLCVQVADNLVNLSQIGFGGNPHVDGAFLRGLEKDGVFPEYLRRVLLVLPEEVHKAEIFFDLQPNVATNHALYPSSNKIGLLVGDSKELEILRMILLNRGFRVLLKEEIELENSAIGAAVVDVSAGEPLVDSFQKQGIVLMDFAKWKSDQTTSLGANCLNARKLCDWLDKGTRQLNRRKSS